MKRPADSKSQERSLCQMLNNDASIVVSDPAQLYQLDERDTEYCGANQNCVG